MKQQFGLIQRPWGVYYLKNKITGEQTSLKTRDRAEAQRLLQAHNETESQPHFNLALARVYINGADPKLATRTWQEVMEHIVAKKTDETRRRWEVAIKDKNFDCIRNLPVAETRPEHFDRALADGKVSTNVYLRRIHNHALGMEWLLKSGHPAPAMAQAGVQAEARHHQRRARGDSYPNWRQAFSARAVTLLSEAEIASRRAAALEAIARAAGRAGRSPEGVALLAVTKGHPAELVRRAARQGSPSSEKTGSRRVRPRTRLSGPSFPA